MNPIFISFVAGLTGLIWMLSGLLKPALLNVGYDVVPEDNILVAITAVLFLLVIKRLRFIISYTDEVIPYYLSLLGFALAASGVFLYTRLMLLGILCLVAAAYWNKRILASYYR